MAWWAFYKENLRRYPKFALELDLTIAVVGLVIAFLGGAIAVAGVHARWETSTAPNPGLGNIVFLFGIAIFIAGVALALLVVVVWLFRRRNRDKDSAA